MTERKIGEDQLLHMIYRLEMDWDGVQLQTIAVSTMKRDGQGAFKFMIDERARTMVAGLRKQFGIE